MEGKQPIGNECSEMLLFGRKHFARNSVVTSLSIPLCDTSTIASKRQGLTSRPLKGNRRSKLTDCTLFAPNNSLKSRSEPCRGLSFSQILQTIICICSRHDRNLVYVSCEAQRASGTTSAVLHYDTIHSPQLKPVLCHPQKQIPITPVSVSDQTHPDLIIQAGKGTFLYL